MSGHDRGQARTARDLERKVIEYLRADPGFFTRHPGLASQLTIPHGCHGAVSLIEHQVAGLRREVARLNRQQRALVDNARHNEDLSRRLHALVLDLLDVDRLDELLATLYQRLEADFRADFVALRIFAAARLPENRGLAELCPAPCDAPRELAELLSRRQPSCGPGDASVLDLLFPARAGQVGSVCLLPFNAAGAPALLGIASRSARRFDARMGTHYLRRLADLLGRLVGAKL